MTLRESIERDIVIARESLVNAKTREEANNKVKWLRQCIKRLEEYDNESELRKNP